MIDGENKLPCIKSHGMIPGMETKSLPAGKQGFSMWPYLPIGV